MVVGPPPPYDDAVVKPDKDDEAIGVVSTVTALHIGPVVVVMIGEAEATSCVDRPLSSARKPC